MWEAHRLKSKYEDLSFGAVGTQGSVRVKEAGTGGAVTGEVSSCSFPAGTSQLKNPVPREGEIWLVAQYVLGRSHQGCVQERGLVPSVQMQWRCCY